ncbi:MULTISPECIES: MAPEG family protein [unclassified Ruegeria]|uniref:MAPEG family protein n=1 Tax=unclassified Ruegeria TaxID=2625375 RepID=UPI001ADB9B82|nr:MULTISPECIES: MAPEG family protein [unclassified Ruegeria]MBO9411558.1 MAPEG family protein [Ruegeria sp. R8_1]MBO9415880.1 MAPEG family protein [Ruegeria sp. R8_2]
MTPETTVLTLAALLWAVQFIAYLAVGHGKIDLNKAMGPRDTEVDRPGASGRMHRALSNMTEGLTLFAIAALVITVTGQSTSFTATAAWIFLIARVLYVPAYALGWTPWRTIIWMAGFLATVAMLLAALF